MNEVVSARSFVRRSVVSEKFILGELRFAGHISVEHAIGHAFLGTACPSNYFGT